MSVLDDITYRRAESKDLAAINQLYDAIFFKPSTQYDWIVLAEKNHEIIGLSRLILISQYEAEIGGIYVKPFYQGKGIASTLVEKLLLMCDDPSSTIKVIFCLPFKRLKHFYKRYGFDDMNDNVSVPAKVADKFAWCQIQYDEEVILLQWTRSMHDNH